MTKTRCTSCANRTLPRQVYKGFETATSHTELDFETYFGLEFFSMCNIGHQKPRATI